MMLAGGSKQQDGDQSTELEDKIKAAEKDLEKGSVSIFCSMVLILYSDKST